ncbi:NADP-dependent oxidoreductase [Gryllotalpicola ginsengisoli]|uniref:NADP-dependent oxidoreductase n=1 Tax=Gryllotalpicola ginsengisoli TaxID=444608 RepID=UPI0003B3411F|nr:NADP-dependent oxidoreductase [Gryllotalpicola ginsengisoli]
MTKAVRFHEFGGVEVLRIDDIEIPAPGAGEVVVEVRAAAINPGEASIREGRLEQRFKTELPCGEGTDFAGVVHAVGPDVTRWTPGDEVIGWSWARSSHAEQVLVPADQLVPKPGQVPWEAAATLSVAGVTAVAAVDAIRVQPGETVLVAGATGGVGVFAVQLLARAGARVLAVASERHAQWLAGHGATLVPYGDDLASRVRRAAPDGVDAVLDLHGPEYVRLAIDLGVAPERIDSITSFQAAGEVGAKTVGSMEGTTTENLAELARLVAEGELEVPIAATYPLERVRDAFTQLEQGHVLGKIVLIA